MNDHAVTPWPKTGVAISRRRNAAGPILLEPVRDHRIVIHASRATWSTCMATGSRHLRRRGDIDIVPAGEEGGFGADTGCEALEIRVAPSILDHMADQMGRGGGRSSLEARHMLKNERIFHLAMALAGDRDQGEPSDILYADAIGHALAAQLASLSKATIRLRNGLSPRQLQRVLDAVEARIDQPLTIDALAREAGASSSHLRHWFKQSMGTTIHRYIVKRRVERARFLLLQGKLNPSEVALAAGFAHQSHMARWMRRELGYRPSDLRRGDAPLSPG